LARYAFLTTWVLESPVEPVWEAVYDFERWPEWWPGVEEAVELEPGDELGVGKLGRSVWKSRLPYRVRFEMRTTRVDRPRLLEGIASGELAGLGRWRFFECGDATAVVYEWQVETTARWMNLLAPLARAAFSWNHDAIMRGGAEGLARRLSSRLLLAG
jgi:polyketide cyclase/dehydrase/lipid transport protein